VDYFGNEAISIYLVTLAVKGLLCVSSLVLIYDFTHDQLIANAFEDAIDYVSDTISEVFFYISSETKDKTDEKTNDIVDPPETGTTYYHVTTPEAANFIISSGVMYGSFFEGGYVYA
jgi:hypothetical protein